MRLNSEVNCIQKTQASLLSSIWIGPLKTIMTPSDRAFENKKNHARFIPKCNGDEILLWSWNDITQKLMCSLNHNFA